MNGQVCAFSMQIYRAMRGGRSEEEYTTAVINWKLIAATLDIPPRFYLCADESVKLKSASVILISGA